MKDFLFVFVTASSQDEAETIARRLIDSGVSACVNILPSILSVYVWQGETRRDEESLMIIKTTVELFPKVRDIVESLHSYEVPEVVGVPVAAVSDKYRSYLEAFFAGGR
ncbi:MAG TPA: divalent-cation tolerance protein CutA [Candidatus Bathyarchaeia archaeon]|nr:divalent-cation tolerance protein CutA [Candidatus Bathyarchaeia archaeon]